MVGHEFHVEHTLGGALYLKCCVCGRALTREQWTTAPGEACPGADEYDMDHEEKTGAPYEASRDA